MFRRWTTSRTWVLIVGAAAVLALAVLSAGLTDMRFRTPGGFFLQPREPTSLPAATALSAPNAWLERLIVIVAVFASIALVISLFDKKARKLFLKLLFYTTLFLLVSKLLPTRGPEPIATAPPVTAVAEGGLGQGATVAAYRDPYISPLMAYLLALLLVLMAAGVAWYLWNQRPRPYRDAGALSGIRRIAESTRDELTSGLHWRDAVIRCYVRMTDTVASGRGLVRRPSMTPEEFAARLTQAGLPPGSVQRLTQLFESARYGGKRSSQADADEAVACLNEIVAASGGVE
jgi:hypothetical protein